MENELKKLLSMPDPLQFNQHQCEWLLDHIGDPNAEIRGNLVYSLLARGFLTEGFTTAQRKAIATRTTQQAQLFTGLNNSDNDKVFTRTFTALLGAILLETDSSKPFLTDKQIQTWIDWALKYLQVETDWRGYVPVKGWAHGIAHGSDLLAAAAAHPKITTAQLQQALDVVANVLAQQKKPFLDDEEERLAMVVLRVSQNSNHATDSISRFFNETDIIRWTDYTEHPHKNEAYYRVSSWKRLMMTLYFMAPSMQPTLLPLVTKYFQKMGYLD